MFSRVGLLIKTHILDINKCSQLSAISGSLLGVLREELHK
jgi:hypothetical protein